MEDITGREFIIKFYQDKAYLTENKSIALADTGLPDTVVSFSDHAYWQVRILNFNADNHKVFAEIIAYYSGISEFGQVQKSLAASLALVDKVSFRSINTSKMLHTMGRITGSELPRNPQFNHVQEGDENILPDSSAPEIPHQATINEVFTVPVKKLRFAHGKVSFDRYFSVIGQSIAVDIINYEIREEFDAVKNYFANIWGSKTIYVQITLQIFDNQVVSVEALSPEISRINKQVIENVKFEFVKSFLRKKPGFDGDKSLFTMDEFFDAFTDQRIKSGTFYQNERELFEDLLLISKTRHYKHLRYLSSLHAYTILKLRFIHKPVSFIFLISGERKFHIVWETLDTEEATYVWHIEKDIAKLRLMLQKIEDIINTIKVQGKIAYINSQDFEAQRIFHDYSEIADGFVKWKSELENYLN